MPTLAESYAEVRAALIDHYGRRSLAVPSADDPFAKVVATLLGQSAEPRAVEAALAGLREAGLLEPAPLAGVDPTELVEVLRGSGSKLNPKGAGTLRRLARWFEDRGATIADAATETLREELLAISGIGPATADAILLQALRRPSYPVDRATYRVLVRHDWLDVSAGYDEARDLLVGLEPDEPARLAELGSWLDRIGAEFCKASRPHCDRCPLRPFLPEGGPRAPEP